MAPLSLALLHYPILDKSGDIVTTALTNLDVHDIARSSRTYDLENYFVVTPITAMQNLLQGMLDHWQTGAGKKRVPARAEAFSRVQHADDLETVVERMRQRHGVLPRIVATAARPPEGWTAISFKNEAQRLRDEDTPTLVIFGTGHGLAPQVMQKSDAVLEPIRGGGYYHLSVRSAVAICLDRLVGERQ